MVRKRKILITGATGYIGSNFIKKFEEDYEFLIIKRKASNCTSLEGKIQIDFEDLTLKAIQDFSPEFFIHFASKSGFNHKTEEIPDYIQSNITFPSVITDFFVKSGGRKILNIGSYWQHYENELYNPNSFYAATKQAFEDILEFYVRSESVEVVSIRLFDTYGPNDPRLKLLGLIRNAANKKEKISVTSGKQLLYLTHIDDVLDGVESALDCFKAGHTKYLLKSSQPMMLKKIVDLYIKVNNLSIDIDWGSVPHSRRDFFSSIDVLPDLPDWKAKVSLETGLKNL